MKRSLGQRISNAGYYCGEYLTVKLAGDRLPTGWRRRMFRFPIALYKWGLGERLGRRILLIRTVGRKTGKPRVTALEFLHDNDDTFFVMAGWGGRTDWFRNIERDPTVRVRVGEREFESEARILEGPASGEVMRRWIEHTPLVARLLEHDTGIHYQGTADSATELASHYGVVALRPQPRSK